MAIQGNICQNEARCITVYIPKIKESQKIQYFSIWNGFHDLITFVVHAKVQKTHWLIVINISYWYVICFKKNLSSNVKLCNNLDERIIFITIMIFSIFYEFWLFYFENILIRIETVQASLIEYIVPKKTQNLNHRTLCVLFYPSTFTVYVQVCTPIF